MGHTAVWGFALLVLAGGLLNFLGWVGLPSVLFLVVTGAGLFALEAWRSWTTWTKTAIRWVVEIPREPLVTAGVVLVGALLLLRYATAVAGATPFNRADDFQGYLVYPTQMLQLGKMTDDPFACRRCVGGLGGGYFLNVLVLALLDHQNLQILDAGLGLLIAFAGFVGLSKELGLSRRNSLIPLFLVAFVPPPQLNIASLLLPVGFVVSLVRLLAYGDESWKFSLRGTILLALIVSSASSLKGSVLPFMVLLMGAFYLLACFTPPRGRVLRCVALFGAVFVAALCPWMLSLRSSCGTLLYPMLGTGYEALPPASRNLAWAWMPKVLACSIPFALLLVLFVFYSHYRKLFGTQLRRAVISLLTSASVGSLALGVGTGGLGFLRYPYPFTFSALVVCLLISIVVARTDERRPIARLGAGLWVFLALTLFSGGVAWGATRGVFWNWLVNIRSGMTATPIVTPEDRNLSARLQDSIPGGAAVLTDLDHPFLLDFRRHRLYVADFIGTWGAPPGMPFQKGPHALREYLLDQSIQYVAFAHDGPWGGGRTEVVQPIQQPGQHPWFKAVASRSLDATDSIALLAGIYRRVYDDNLAFVLDLRTPQLNLGPATTRP
jgi:hypothetical protein